MPVIKAAQKLKEMEFGQVLEIIADDEMIIDDMPAWCKSTGNLFLGYKEEDGEFKVYVRKKVIRSNR
jgi:TusA-related sulfurtransferase